MDRDERVGRGARSYRLMSALGSRTQIRPLRKSLAVAEPLVAPVVGGFCVEKNTITFRGDNATTLVLEIDHFEGGAS